MADDLPPTEDPQDDGPERPERPKYDGPLIAVEEEMRRSYLDYAMSVIVSRAIPDLRDGLKPVHRRILYSVYENGYTHNKSYKKSALIVGDVMGRYHPHGDGAIYDALVRMAQDFSMSAMLIDGQGNFGSMDGDSPAAMRYTEARSTKLAESFTEDIDKDTVDFQANYSNDRQEPMVLPARYPNLLVNGAQGIAVGMATNIPPAQSRRGDRRDAGADREPGSDDHRTDGVHPRAGFPDRRARSSAAPAPARPIIWAAAR